ncbi:hypothetical protein RF11_10878 [Thelohanellus kitauei]|uniref:Uncharacterized protein n=1 Tax=Thelohanellus kitauei TaxID=669202 RepID=A0A0C2M179_THEKT|nr:hypothetical protein RF11_10878 [Thelohanellus kitauei]
MLQSQQNWRSLYQLDKAFYNLALLIFALLNIILSLLPTTYADTMVIHSYRYMNMITLVFCLIHIYVCLSKSSNFIRSLFSNLYFMFSYYFMGLVSSVIIVYVMTSHIPHSNRKPARMTFTAIFQITIGLIYGYVVYKYFRIYLFRVFSLYHI